MQPEPVSSPVAPAAVPQPRARAAGAWRLGAEVLALAWALGLLAYYYWSRGYLDLPGQLFGGTP